MSEFELNKTRPAHPPKRRRYTRVDVQLVVEYEFITPSGNRRSDRSFEGTTRDISGGGCLLRGPIPCLHWIPELLLQDLTLGVNMNVPVDDFEVHARANVAWVDPVDEAGTYAMGLSFADLSDQERTRIIDFVIRKTTSET